MFNFLFYFSLFFIYSVLGWITEMFVVNIYRKKVSNRGFLIGPYCPIYGVTAIIMILFLGKSNNDLVTLFFMTIIICSTIEYITSLIMEKLFKARWWDYTERTLNIDGRVCLSNSIAFGVLGVLLIKYINPLFKTILLLIPIQIFVVISIILLLVFVTDFILSFNIVFNLKKTAETLRKDYTDEISDYIKETLKNKSKLFKRILNAFPNLDLRHRRKK